MARFVKQANNISMRYQFDLEIEWVEVNIEMEVQVIVIWKRGKFRFDLRS